MDKMKLFKLMLTGFALWVLCNTPSLTYSQTFEWAKSLVSRPFQLATSMAVDNNGDNYLTGGFKQTVDFDPGPGTANLTSAGGTDMFVSKLDASGNFAWAKRIGGPGTTIAYDMKLDNTGNIYLTGAFQQTVDFDPGPGITNLTSEGLVDIFVLKLDGSGNFVWAKRFGGISRNGASGHGIALDRSGNIHITGTFVDSIDFDPGPGTAILRGAGTSDVFVLKLDANGDFVWVKGIAGSSVEIGYKIEVDASGNVYSIGEFEGTQILIQGQESKT
ncbi:MAG: SBBP repeat-containing protein [Bacteroidia bacterium]